MTDTTNDTPIPSVAVRPANYNTDELRLLKTIKLGNIYSLRTEKLNEAPVLFNVINTSYFPKKKDDCITLRSSEGKDFKIHPNEMIRLIASGFYKPVPKGAIPPPFPENTPTPDFISDLPFDQQEVLLRLGVGDTFIIEGKGWKVVHIHSPSTSAWNVWQIVIKDKVGNHWKLSIGELTDLLKERKAIKVFTKPSAPTEELDTPETTTEDIPTPSAPVLSSKPPVSLSSLASEVADLKAQLAQSTKILTDLIKSIRGD